MLKQRSIALKPKQWDELGKEAARSGIGLAEYLRQLLDRVRDQRDQLVAEAEGRDR